MGIFGLPITSLDALISLLLIETAWWSTRLFGVILPRGLELIFEHYFWDLGFVTLTVLPILLIAILKFLVQGILWYAFLRNEANEPARFPRYWYWIGLALDLITVARIILFSVGSGRGFYWLLSYFTVLLIPFLLIRAGIWIFGRRLISDLSIYDKSYFPSGFIAYATDQSRTEASITVILVWELVWYAISSLGLILSIVFSTDMVIIPSPKQGYLGINSLCVLAVPVALLLLLGVTRAWKGFLKCWLPIYILNNIIGYVLLSLNELRHEIEHAHSLTLYLFLGINVLFPLCALGLKLMVAIGSFKLVRSEAEATPGKGKEDEEKPLIIYRIK